MIKTLIVSGGKINKKFIENYLNLNDFENIIAVDKGLESLNKLKIKPNHIVGDFDSINKNILKKYLNKKEIQIHKFNSEKNYTDTHLALKLALKLKSKQIIILGAIGTRIDHTIANINILYDALKKDVNTKIINEYNQIQIIKKSIKIEQKYKYLSLIPLTTKVKGITLNGFKYQLKKGNLKIGESLGISNEQIKKIAEIKIKKGILIVIQSKD